MAEWVDVYAAADLPNAGIGEATVDDLDIVVWRSAGGELCAMEARCPHQWSHLGAEGVVVGDEIVCCSHFWRFTRDGAGWKENVKGRRDRKADIETYPCKEEAGRIWIEVDP